MIALMSIKVIWRSLQRVNSDICDMRSACEFVDDSIRASANLATDTRKASKEDHGLTHVAEPGVSEVARRRCMQ